MKQILPYLKHILDEINFLIDKTADITFEDYLKDEVLKRATTRSFEIIGEAVKIYQKISRINIKKLNGKKLLE